MIDIALIEAHINAIGQDPDFFNDNFKTKEGFYQWLNNGLDFQSFEKNIECILECREILIRIECYQHVMWIDDYLKENNAA